MIENTTIPENSLLASIDVSSLYTNIPHNEGLQSTAHFLKNKQLSYAHAEQPEPDIIIELARKITYSSSMKSSVYKNKAQRWEQK